MKKVANIYHVKLPDGRRLDYDSYSEFVAVANTEEEARNLHPSGSDSNWEHVCGEWVEKNETSTLIVAHIGISLLDIVKPTVITTSYHSG